MQKTAQHPCTSLQKLFPLLLLLVSLYGLSSCSSISEPEISPDEQYTVADIMTWDKNKEDYVNPFKEGTYKHFVARKDYPETYDVWEHKEKVSKANGKNSKIIVKIGGQRGKFMVNNEVAIDFPISTGVAAYPTKTGSYKIISKKAEHRSNLYGNIYDADGKMTVYNADTTKDVVPEGGRFEGSSMPYFMRLTNAGLGLHVGKVRRKPVSHGCIRTPRAVCSTIFSKVVVGTPVDIIK